MHEDEHTCTSYHDQWDHNACCERPHSWKCSTGEVMFKRLPLLSGSSIKWEMHPVFSVSESLSLLAKFTRVADFQKMTCLCGLASLHIHNPLWCTNKWNEDLKEQRVSEYLGLRSCCEFCTDETQFGQNRSVLVLSDHGQSVALCCLGVRLPSSFYDLAFNHVERFTGG